MAFFWFCLQIVQDDRLWIIIFLDPLVSLKIPFKMHQIFIFRVYHASIRIFSVKAPTLTNHTNKLNHPPSPVTLKKTPKKTWKNQNHFWPAPLPSTRWHILTRAFHFLYLLNQSPTPTTSLSLTEPRETKLTLWMRFNCLEATEPLRDRNSWCSFDQPRKDKRLSQPWSHSGVLDTGRVDWKSSALTTRQQLVYLFVRWVPTIKTSCTKFSRHKTLI